MKPALIDFRSAGRAPAIGWVMLALGVTVLSTALWFDRTWTVQRAEAEQARRATEDAARQARELASRPVQLTAEELRLRATEPLLRQPWLPVLRVIESVTEPPVYLLGLTIEPSSGQIRIEAEAPSFADALEYAKTLRNEEVLAPAQLRSHEGFTDPNTGRQATRFTVTSQWISR
jgi:hypothetical protein